MVDIWGAVLYIIGQNMDWGKVHGDEVQRVNLIDAIGERHMQLREFLDVRWNEMSDIYLSHSEWRIITQIYREEQTTISTVTKHMDISRQATHKFIKRMTEKGLVIVMNQENNKKEKAITLTSLGKECYEKNETLKTELETKIAEHIGAENIQMLSKIIHMDWGLK
ncbi:hypothetical protein JNUCC1_00805 [Lentibacillus sp. JNUCC-1]|uniref:MarR family winged helix-turn-helix transcriptional regulator n=1 Tax=Lentibacillus sp. JNUCC-1 TaxID=2654513 RepID=UPI001320A402|nr:MarR family winged helix-turn-helix transcriptional regulator [Lentibacillus sp. JNUCC-1]MUV36999.1 hypothetical protein [Lentibacillus sp. JNUCC-1]